MRAVVYQGARDLRVETVADASIVNPADAVVRVTHAAICGSDLWFYRGITDQAPTRTDWSWAADSVRPMWFRHGAPEDSRRSSSSPPTECTR